MSVIGLLVLTGVCIIMAAFFEGAEIIILSADWTLIKRHAVVGTRPRTLAEGFLKKPQWYMAAAMTGSTLALCASAVPVTVFFLDGHGERGLIFAAAFLVPLFILFGSLVPKTYFLTHADNSAVLAVRALRIFIVLFFPVVLVLIGFAKLTRVFYGGRAGINTFWYTRDELKTVLSGPSSQITFGEEGSQIIDRIFDFSDTVVEEVMIPLVHVEALSLQSTVSASLEKISSSMYSRYPVFSERIDNIVGMLRTIDLLDGDGPDEPIKPLTCNVRYVPYNKPADELLIDMQRENFDFAVVVDEFGGCIGLITREDIIEEVVGEIDDEHDDPVELCKRLDNKRVLINALMEIWDINQDLDWDLPEGEYETLGGFILHLFNRIPKEGERILYKNLLFTIEKATPRAVLEVMVEETKGQK